VSLHATSGGAAAWSAGDYGQPRVTGPSFVPGDCGVKTALQAVRPSLLPLAFMSPPWPGVTANCHAIGTRESPSRVLGGLKCHGRRRTKRNRNPKCRETYYKPPNHPVLRSWATLHFDCLTLRVRLSFSDPDHTHLFWRWTMLT
jgi:hypothetical protein